MSIEPIYYKMGKSIKRNNDFYTESEFSFESSFVDEFLDLGNHKILYFKVDTKKTKTHKLYGDIMTDEIRFKEAIEIPCKIVLDKADEGSKSDGFGYQERLSAVVAITENFLNKANLKVEKGDYFKYETFDTNESASFFEITRPNYSPNDSAMTKGFKNRMRKILAIEVFDDVIEKIKQFEEGEVN